MDYNLQNTLRFFNIYVIPGAYNEGLCNWAWAFQYNVNAGDRWKNLCPNLAVVVVEDPENGDVAFACEEHLQAMELVCHEIWPDCLNVEWRGILTGQIA